MERELPRLIQEFQTEAANISDLESLAELCNDKVGELANYCNEGMSEMAELMIKRNDSYETYERWSNKLLENYLDLASEITDVYMESGYDY